MTPESITAIFAGILAVFHGWTLWRQKVIDARQKVNAERIEEVQTEVETVSRKQDETISIVNGPLGAALKTAADALEILADIRGDNESIMKAHAARQQSNEHIEARRDAVQMAQSRTAAEQKIIEDFKRRKDPKPVATGTADESGKKTTIPVTVTTTVK